MIVVSDTSCVTNLLAIGHADLLQKMFGEVIVPGAVWRELEAGHLSLPPFLRMVPVCDAEAARVLATGPLAEGEAEAIILARETGAEFLLMDETAGRVLAIQQGLRVLGLLGVLRRAKQNGLILAIKPLIERLRDDAGFWMSEALIERVLLDAGE